MQRQQDLTLGYLRQEAVLTFRRAGKYDLRGDADGLCRFAARWKRELRELEAAMATGMVRGDLFEQYGGLARAYEVAGGYQL